MSNITISVIVPIYKVEIYLRECIDSLVNQSYTNIEIILVDDGSPDKCPEICDEYRDSYQNIIVVHKNNGGLVSARKAGVQVSHGEYIAYVDGDDYVEENHFEIIAEAISKYGADIISTDYSVCKNDKKIIQVQPITDVLLGKEEIQNTLVNQMISFPPFFTFGVFPSVWTKCIRRELALKYQLSVPETIVMGEDAALTYPCILNANSYCHINECGYIYRITPTSITNSYDANLSTKITRLLEYLSNFFSPLSAQMVDYTNFLTIRVISNEIIGNDDIRAAVQKIAKYFKENLIYLAIKKGKLPAKDRFLLFCIKNKLYVLLTAIKLHWLRSGGKL